MVWVIINAGTAIERGKREQLKKILQKNIYTGFFQCLFTSLKSRLLWSGSPY